ncbi:MAG: hypothetical protein ACP5OA_03515, partial [Candidatus Woesearchaeota archaeon]
MKKQKINKITQARLIKISKLKANLLVLKHENREQEHVINQLDTQLSNILQLKGGLLKKSTTVIDLSHVPLSGIHREGIALSMISDSHVDEVINPDRVLGLNKHNPDIAKKRMSDYFFLLLKEINRWRKELVVDELHLMILGDLTSGNIHYALVETNAVPPINAMLYAQTLLVQGIKYLVENGNFKKIRVFCVTGNHPRITAKLMDKTRTGNSLEYYAYRVIEDLFKNVLTGYENVEFVIAEGALLHVKTQYGKSYLLSHGDQIKYQGGVGGVMIPAMRWWLQINKTIPSDKTFMGHHHHWIPQSDITINGSMVGYNEYAMGKGFQYQPPIQHLELLD